MEEGSLNEELAKDNLPDQVNKRDATWKEGFKITYWLSYGIGTSVALPLRFFGIATFLTPDVLADGSSLSTIWALGLTQVFKASPLHIISCTLHRIFDRSVVLPGFRRLYLTIKPPRGDVALDSSLSNSDEEEDDEEVDDLGEDEGAAFTWWMEVVVSPALQVCLYPLNSALVRSVAGQLSGSPERSDWSEFWQPSRPWYQGIAAHAVAQFSYLGMYFATGRSQRLPVRLASHMVVLGYIYPLLARTSAVAAVDKSGRSSWQILKEIVSRDGVFGAAYPGHFWLYRLEPFVASSAALATYVPLAAITFSILLFSTVFSSVLSSYTSPTVPPHVIQQNSNLRTGFSPPSPTSNTSSSSSSNSSPPPPRRQNFFAMHSPSRNQK